MTAKALARLEATEARMAERLHRLKERYHKIHAAVLAARSQLTSTQRSTK